MHICGLLLATLLARDVVLIPGSFVPGRQPDGNTIVFTGGRGLVVVDTGRHESHTQKILDLARETRKPVTAIVNSHWHLDHIGGNAMLRREYPNVRVYASSAFAEAREGFLKRSHAQLEEMIRNEKDPARQETYRVDLKLIENADALAPDVIVGRSQTLKLAGRRLDVNLESHAVTAGDLWLYDRRSRLLIAGDLVTLPVPFLDTACPANWSKVLDRLAAVDFEKLVPGHGAPMSRTEFEMYRSAFRNLRTCAGSSESKDACADGWMKDTASLLSSENPKFVRAMLDYYVGDVLRGDPAKIRERC
jgi:glyoxylase-like metal-dependent hydrolase (beta-lactamase superfamily II)